MRCTASADLGLSEQYVCVCVCVHVVRTEEEGEWRGGEGRRHSAGCLNRAPIRDSDDGSPAIRKRVRDG